MAATLVSRPRFLTLFYDSGEIKIGILRLFTQN